MSMDKVMSMDKGELYSVDVVADLLRRYPEVQYLRLRTFPPKEPAAQVEAMTPEGLLPILPLERALRHHRGHEELMPVEAPASATADAVRAQLEKVATNGAMVGLCSRVELRSGRAQHALLVDFRCAHSCLPRLEEACVRLGYPGYILRTSASYHFYGSQLVEEAEWITFMATWALLEDLTDVRYIAHCLIERIGCLRVTGNEAWPEPVVVARIEGRG
jgi:hypothetical protein